MKRGIIGAGIVCASILLVGCTSKPAEPQTTTPSTTNQSAAAKSGTTTKTGTVTKVGSKYLLKAAGQSIDIDSYNIDLSQYAGKSVTLSGQYSGDTLFVSEVK